MKNYFFVGIIFSSCKTDSNRQFENALEQLTKTKTDEFVIHKRSNSVAFSNQYGMNTWSSIGKSGVDRLITPTVIVSYNSVLFHFIFKFDSKVPIDISGNAVISNESNLSIEIPLERVKDDEYIGFMGYVKNENDVQELNTIIGSDNPIIAIEGGSERLWFNLHQSDKEMIRSTTKLFFEIWKLKNPNSKIDLSLQTNNSAQYTEKVNRERYSDVHNISGEFEAYFPCEPKADKSSYLKEKKILHYFCEDSKNMLRFDGSKFPDIINNQNIKTLISDFIYSETQSVDGELFHNRSILHNGNEAFYYVLIYASEGQKIIKHSILVAKKNNLYKWSVQGYDGISDQKASEIFYKKKHLFKVL